MKKIISLLMTLVLFIGAGFCVTAEETSVDIKDEAYIYELKMREEYKNKSYYCTIIDNVVYRKDEKSYSVVDFLGFDEDGNDVKKVVVKDKIDSLPVKGVECYEYIAYEALGTQNDSIKEIVLPDTIEYIGDYAFWRHYRAKVTHIPNKLTTIGSYSCLANKRKKLVLPDTVTYIGDDAFRFEHSLEKITFPKKIKDIPDGVLSYCSSLKKVTFKGKVKTIGIGAFLECKNLKSITIPKTVEKIGESAFDGCKSLKKITIPKNVKKIERSAFNGCKKLSKVVFKGYKCPEIDPGTGKISTFYSTFGKTKKGIRFQVRTRAIAKQLKAELKNTGVKKAKIYVGDKLIYKNVK